jgi:peptidyl-prolyl cis-trans isomerase C
MNHSRILLTAVALAALAACQPKTAAPVATDTSPPVATVNGVPITRDFYEFTVKGVSGKPSAQLSPQDRAMALDNLVHAEVLAQQASKEGLDKSGDAAYMLELARLNILSKAVSEQYMKDKKPTDAELHTEYDSLVAKLPKEDYHARHILVATQEFAQKVIDRLAKGEKFEDIAKAVSMDSSKDKGGDLGWVDPNRMVPEFAKAMEALKPGQYTHTPVQTQFGWHVIQLLETRPHPAPPFDQSKEQVGRILEQTRFRDYTDDLVKNAKIEKFLDQPASGSAPAAGTAAPGATPAAPGAEAPAAPAATAAPAPAPTTAPAPSPKQ